MVDDHAKAVAGAAGDIDISFNLISRGDVQGTAMAEMEVEDRLRPVGTAVRTPFLTSRVAARHMLPRGGGVILVFDGAADPPRGYRLGGLQTAFHAMEAMRRQLSMELGAHGVRVVTLRTGGIPEAAATRSGQGSRARPCWRARRRSRTSATSPRSSPPIAPGA